MRSLWWAASCDRRSTVIACWHECRQLARDSCSQRKSTLASGATNHSVVTICKPVEKPSLGCSTRFIRRSVDYEEVLSFGIGIMGVEGTRAFRVVNLLMKYLSCLRGLLIRTIHVISVCFQLSG